MNNDIIQQALQLWSNGKALEAGKLIFEDLPNDLRPIWAARIFKLILDKSSVKSTLFDQVLDIANNKTLWNEGHKVFDNVRKSTLNFDEMRRQRTLSTEEKLIESITTTAELICKVTYNSSNPIDEFDENSGWYLAPYLRSYYEHRWENEDFLQEAWNALIAPLDCK